MVDLDTSELRRAVIQRLGNVCHDCGRELPAEQLILHHLREGRGYQNPERYRDLRKWLNNPDADGGVVALCDACHRKRHKMRPRAFPIRPSEIVNDLGNEKQELGENSETMEVS